MTNSQTGQPILQLKDVAFAYPSMPAEEFVIAQFSLSVSSGEIVRVCGRNGAGKTTLLRLIAGELAPSQGERKELKAGLRAVYLNQHTADFLGEALTVQEQLAMKMSSGLSPLHDARRQTSGNRVTEFLAAYGVGLEDKLDSFTCELSGGQRQIVALLSVLQDDVDILVLDEFTAHMDSQSVAESKRLVANVVRMRQAAVVFASHRDEVDKSDKLVEL